MTHTAATTTQTTGLGVCTHGSRAWTVDPILVPLPKDSDTDPPRNSGNPGGPPGPPGENPDGSDSDGNPDDPDGDANALRDAIMAGVT